MRGSDDDDDIYTFAYNNTSRNSGQYFVDGCIASTAAPAASAAAALCAVE